jgi:hypothetical protein
MIHDDRLGTADDLADLLEREPLLVELRGKLSALGDPFGASL